MKKSHKNVKSKEPKVMEQIRETFIFEHELRLKVEPKKEVKDEPLDLVIENVFTIKKDIENETFENGHGESPIVIPMFKESKNNEIVFKNTTDEVSKEDKNEFSDVKGKLIVKIDEMIDLTTLDDTTEKENESNMEIDLKIQSM